MPTVRLGGVLFSFLADNVDYLKKMASTRRATKRTGAELGRLQRSAAAAAKTVRVLGVAAAGYAGFQGLRASIGAIASTSVQLGDALTAVQVHSRAADEQIGRLRVSLLRMSSESGVLATEIARVGAALAETGLSARQVDLALGPAVDLQRVTNRGLDESARLLSSSVKAFRLDFAEAGRVADAFVATSTRTSSTVDDLARGMVQAGPAFAAANLEVEAFAAAMGTLADAGVAGRQAASGLRIAISRLDSPTESVARALADMGIAVDEVDVGTRGLAAVLDTLAQSGLDYADASRLVGEEGARALLVLIEQREQLAGMEAQLREAAGAARETADALDDNLRGSLDRIQRAIGRYVQTLYEATGATGVIRAALDELSDSFDSATDRILIGRFAGEFDSLRGEIETLQTMLEQTRTTMERIAALNPTSPFLDSARDSIERINEQLEQARINLDALILPPAIPPPAAAGDADPSGAGADADSIAETVEQMRSLRDAIAAVTEPFEAALRDFQRRGLSDYQAAVEDAYEAGVAAIRAATDLTVETRAELLAALQEEKRIALELEDQYDRLRRITEDETAGKLTLLEYEQRLLDRSIAAHVRYQDARVRAAQTANERLLASYAEYYRSREIAAAAARDRGIAAQLEYQRSRARGAFATPDSGTAAAQAGARAAAQAASRAAREFESLGSSIAAIGDPLRELREEQLLQSLGLSQYERQVVAAYDAAIERIAAARNLTAAQTAELVRQARAARDAALAESGLADAIEETARQQRRLDEFSSRAADAFVAGLRDARRGVGELRDAFDSLGRAIEDELINRLVRAPIGNLFDLIFSGFAAPVQWSGARQHGGYTRRGIALVGERGPELADFRSPGRVYSNDALREIIADGRINVDARFQPTINSADPASMMAAARLVYPEYEERTLAAVARELRRPSQLRDAARG